LLAGFYLWLEV